jgi:hypothetical protein
MPRICPGPDVFPLDLRMECVGLRGSAGGIASVGRSRAPAILGLIGNSAATYTVKDVAVRMSLIAGHRRIRCCTTD